MNYRINFVFELGFRNFSVRFDSVNITMITVGLDIRMN